jgi:hypothetical protein
MTPGNTVNTAISIKNTGTANAATFTLTRVRRAPSRRTGRRTAPRPTSAPR